MKYSREYPFCEPTGELRWRVPKGTTTRPAVLQQAWRIFRERGALPSDIEWRDVPIEQEELNGK